MGTRTKIATDTSGNCIVAEYSAEGVIPSGDTDSLRVFAHRTMLLLITVLDWCHGLSMPIQRPHHASAKGVQVEMAAAGMLRNGAFSIDTSQCDVDVAVDRDKGKILLNVHSQMVSMRTYLKWIG